VGGENLPNNNQPDSGSFLLGGGKGLEETNVTRIGLVLRVSLCRDFLASNFAILKTIQPNARESFVHSAPCNFSAWHSSCSLNLATAKV
jgi:hypothetical protein